MAVMAALSVVDYVLVGFGIVDDTLMLLLLFAVTAALFLLRLQLHSLAVAVVAVGRHCRC
eukprot:scaffold147505_cov19-Prasinocladus_malaysianus.AAC.2